ncbi:DcaP family trimeric outer membrane transporter [Novosphingobium album (ex Liu et al. 2023)]|uniref:DcaP family trimeric outer membrane transporter n=1 Tax=Novosphingobium album (ex Liu et al. 2023) TaxID=3031130 RepID=A0ABT5WVM7_9SPHN|nr:DcaP family trimeric outer membrane transporter [Novosphingobium album (ex Liu et al. 2023)]MDE8653912.1 DcaP family trimeric outer membrane transporter [Novosphingobium album (ex Liu et al. 2023)]
MHHRKAYLCALLAASALAAPQAAQAAPSREAELEARLERLEAEMMQLRADLAAAKSAQADSTAATNAAVAANATQNAATDAKIAALEAKPQAPAEGFRVGNTTVKLGGFIKLTATSSHFSDGEVATNSLGRDFYLPQSIPTAGGPASHVQDFNAKQSRFWLNLDSSLAGHAVKGYLEVDFQTSAGTQGSQRTTNGYNLALRRAYVQLDRWTFGQDWTTFQYTGALPESTDFVGATEGTVFIRQPLIRYSAPVGQGMTLHIAAEEPESGTAVAGSPALVENGDDRLPDLAARLAWTGKAGEASLAGLARQVRVENAGVSADSFGWGVSAAGKLFLNEGKSSDLRAMVTYGRNIGRYVGLNFAPDAVLVPATGELGDVNIFAALAALRVAVAPQVRVNLMGSYQTVDYASSLSLASLAGFNKRAWSGAANVFYSPVKNVDLGLEYRHGDRRVVGGAQGNLDRLEFAAKYSF